MAEAKKNYYDILGVDKKASADEIKSAYRKLAKQYHPDLHPGDAAAAEKILAVLKEKYGENYAENLFKIELTGVSDVNTAETRGRQ